MANKFPDAIYLAENASTEWLKAISEKRSDTDIKYIRTDTIKEEGRKKMKAEIVKGFTQGVVYAVAQCLRLGFDGAAEQLWNESGFELSDLKCCDEYDVNEIHSFLGRD